MPRPRRKNIWQIRNVPEGFVAGRDDGYAYAHFCIDGMRWRKSLRPLRFRSADKSTAMLVLTQLSEGEAWRHPASKVRIHPRGRVEIPTPVYLQKPEEKTTVDDLYRAFLAVKEGQQRDGLIGPTEPKKLRLSHRAFWAGQQDRFLVDVAGIREHITRRITELEHLSDETKRHYLRKQRQMFDYAVEIDLMPKNPMPKLRHIPLHAAGATPKKRAKKRAFTDAEYARLRKAAYAHSHHLGLVVELLYYTGLRTDEATSLRLVDSWRAEGVTELELAELPHVVPGDFLYIRGKGAHGKPRWRTFPLVLPSEDDESKMAVWQRRQYQIVDELVTVHAPEHDGYLTHLATRTLQLYIQRARKAARVPSEPVDNHSLRRSALTIMTNELRMPEDYLDAVVGNTRKIRSDSYVAAATADQLRQMLDSVEK